MRRRITIATEEQSWSVTLAIAVCTCSSPQKHRWPEVGGEWHSLRLTYLSPEEALLLSLPSHRSVS